MCGICMETFDEGDKLTALPCTSHGCSSVWHLPCIHKWLDQGHAPSCPLCRSQVDTGVATPSAPAFTVIRSDASAGSSRLQRDILGLLFQSFLSRATSRAAMARLAERSALSEQDVDVGAASGVA